MYLNAVLISLIFSIFSINSYSKDKDKTLEIGKIEIIKGKTQMKKVQTIATDFHGKKVKATREEKINQKSVLDNPEANRYLKTVTETIYKFYQKPKKIPAKGASGVIKAKLQIQENGRYDVLFVGGENQFLKQHTENLFYKISNFPAIPYSAGISEFQIELPFKYEFTVKTKSKSKGK